MDFDSLYYPYPSQRRVVFAKNRLVTTSQSLAAQTGIEILKQGGAMPLPQRLVLQFC